MLYLPTDDCSKIPPMRTRREVCCRTHSSWHWPTDAKGRLMIQWQSCSNCAPNFPCCWRHSDDGKIHVSCLFLHDQPRHVLSCEQPKRGPRGVAKGPSAQIVTDVFGLLLSLGAVRESYATRSRWITGRLLFCLRHRVVVDVTLLAASGAGQMERRTSTHRQRFRL